MFSPKPVFTPPYGYTIVVPVDVILIALFVLMFLNLVITYLMFRGMRKNIQVIKRKMNDLMAEYSDVSERLRNASPSELESEEMIGLKKRQEEISAELYGLINLMRSNK